MFASDLHFALDLFYNILNRQPQLKIGCIFEAEIKQKYVCKRNSIYKYKKSSELHSSSF